MRDVGQSQSKSPGTREMGSYTEANMRSPSTPPRVRTAGPGCGTRCRSVREIQREELGPVVENVRERGSGYASDLNPRRNPPPGPIDAEIDVAYESLSSSKGEGSWGSPAGVTVSTASPSYVEEPGENG